MNQREAFKLIERVEWDHAVIVGEIVFYDVEWIARASAEALMREYYKLHGASLVVTQGGDAQALLTYLSDTVHSIAMDRRGY